MVQPKKSKRGGAAKKTAKLLPVSKISKVPFESLRFDVENPRLATAIDIASNSEKEIIRFLAAEADIQELIQSIATNGYIDIEPLVALQSAETFIVLEGNRRLAALKLLAKPSLAQELSVPVPEISADVRSTFENISVYLVANRDDARDFIGFKHINGPHRWDAFAKARFAAKWYKAERHNGIGIREIAKSLGDRHDTVLRLVSGIFVLDQAVEKRLYDLSDRYYDGHFAFSHLYTALTRTGFGNYPVDVPRLNL